MGAVRSGAISKNNDYKLSNKSYTLLDSIAEDEIPP